MPAEIDFDTVGHVDKPAVIHPSTERAFQTRYKYICNKDQATWK